MKRDGQFSLHNNITGERSRDACNIQTIDVKYVVCVVNQFYENRISEFDSFPWTFLPILLLWQRFLNKQVTSVYYERALVPSLRGEEIIHLSRIQRVRSCQ